MPALVLFGRRWEIASDDLVIPTFIDLIIRLSWLIGSFIIVWSEQHLTCSGEYFIKFYYYGFFVINHLIIIMDALLLQSSSSGSIMNLEARKYVPLFLYFRIIGELGSIGWCILGIVWINDKTLKCDDSPLSLQYINCLSIFNITILVLQLLFALYSFDPLGRSNSQFEAFEVENEFTEFNIDMPIPWTKHTKRWEARCRRFVCECSTADETKDTFREVGKIFGSQLAEDLVSSDIAAGLLLLNIQRKQEKISLKMIIVDNKRVISVEPSMQTHDAFLVNFAHTDDWRLPRFLFHFVKFACAAYGWIFVTPSRMFNSCVCCSCLPKRNYRYPKKIVGDNCCLCLTSGVRDLNAIEFEDIAHVTFHNKLFENPFFVAVDHKTNTVVISIRGTLSFNDAVMDMAGWPVGIPGYPACFKAHHGMLKGAQNIKDKLSSLQILPKLLTANPGYTLVLTGQSLGSGLATILSILLRPEYPNLRCYAYSPPGGLLSQEAAEYCNAFLVSVIYGDDMVSRLGVLQFERLKFRLIDALNNCKIPKYRILLRGCFCCSETKSSYYVRSNSDLTDMPDERIEENPVHQEISNVVHSESVLVNGNISTTNICSCDTKPKYSQQHPQTRYPSIQGMYPPGKIFYITEVSKRERKFCDSKWNWRWADRTEFDEIVVSKKMIWDHIPIKMPKSLQYLSKLE